MNIVRANPNDVDFTLYILNRLWIAYSTTKPSGASTTVFIFFTASLIHKCDKTYEAFSLFRALSTASLMRDGHAPPLTTKLYVAVGVHIARATNMRLILWPSFVISLRFASHTMSLPAKMGKNSLISLFAPDNTANAIRWLVRYSVPHVVSVMFSPHVMPSSFCKSTSPGLSSNLIVVCVFMVLINYGLYAFVKMVC